MITRSARLAVGLVLIGLSFSLCLRAHLGLGPWWVLQDGLHQHLGISLGVASYLLNAAWLVAAMSLRERPGPGTFLGIGVGGLILDGMLPLVPAPHGLALRLTTLAVALVILGLGAALVFSASFGVSPLDALMTGIFRRVPCSLRQVRIGLEVLGFALGWIAGGEVGVGCVVIGLGVGPSIQAWLKVLGAMPTKLEIEEAVPV